MSASPLAPGAFRVVVDGRAQIVYVAGPPGHRWAFWNGQVYREAPPATAAARATRGRGAAPSIQAPMPASVLKVIAKPGASVAKGDVLVIVEAMKMELPLRATEPGVVKAVHCREGELVQPDAVLVELE